MRHMMRPFRAGDKLEDHAVPMADILKQLQVQLAEFKALKEKMKGATEPTEEAKPAKSSSDPTRR